jgi:hypothetical protein
MVTNINYAARTMQFWLNEAGGNVTITYNDGSTDANYNGVTTGLNMASGTHTFTVPTAATSYNISVFKVGAGQPALIQSSPAFTPRGVDVNKNPGSPFFGRVYAAISGSPINILHPDMTLDHTAGTGASLGGTCNWFGGGFSPYRISVAADDYLMVGDASWTYGSGVTGALQNDGVWRIDPNVTTAQLFLGPRGAANGIAGIGAGPIHSTIQSRPVVIGNPSLGGPVTLVTVDGDQTWGTASSFNALLVYTNITLAALPWENVPDIQGAAIGLNMSAQLLGGNPYPGLQAFGNYIYSGTYRDNHAWPCVQIYTNDIGKGDTLAEVWDSISAVGGAINIGPDLFFTTNGGILHGTCDLAVSPDGKFIVAQSIANWFVIAYLTNGIPDSSRVFQNTPTSYTVNGRGIAFDAAGNIYSSSSGIGNVQQWTMGITSTCITSGTTNTSTGFSFSNPATEVSVVATTPHASQGGHNGTMGTVVPGVFTITRAGNTASSLQVGFTLSGTATTGVYTVSSGTVPTSTTVATTNSIIIPAGQSSATVTITPTTANVPRLQTTVFLTLLSGSAYSTTLPFSDTVYIQNTSANQLILTPSAATMYKAFSTDFASVLLTRLGDTNATAYTVPATAFSYSGSAVAGTDFTPLSAVTFNPGDFTHTTKMSPLANGVPPVNTVNPTYAGNKSTTVTLAAGTGYTVGANTTTLTLLDNAYPASPVLFADPLTDPADAANWNITYGNGNNAVDQGDYDVEFGYDLTANNPSGNNGSLGIGSPPSGATTALRITSNKSAGYGSMFGGGVNVYFTNQLFSGNYAVRFNMNVVGGDNTYSVEGVMFGINHNGTETNWWLGNGAVAAGSGPWASDGVWYWIQTPPGSYGGFGFSEFEEYTGASALPNTGWQQLATATASTYQNVYKGNLFTALGVISGGTPANNSPVGASPADNTWADVEIKQINNVVTMSIDQTPIFVYTNTLPFTSGYLMLGYDCPIQGSYQQYIGTPDAAAYFSNLRVVKFVSAPVLASITTSGANVVIKFTSTDSTDTTSSFALQSSGTVNGTYTDVSPVATFTQLGSGSFQVTYPQNGNARFYRVRHL